MKKYKDIVGDGGSNILAQVQDQQRRLRSRMDKIRHKIAVVSGKGGVGKSAFCANLACGLAQRQYRVGVLDADLNGPSMARMLGIQDRKLSIEKEGVKPAVGPLGIQVISMGILLEENAPTRWKSLVQEESFIWRGAMEAGTLREFLSDVNWGDLDFLLLDLPPGTDRIATLGQLLPEADLVVLTLPSDVSQMVVKKSLALAQEARLSILGLVENMAGLFPGHASGEELAKAFGVRFLGAIPYDPALTAGTDQGQPLVLSPLETPSRRAMESVTEALLDILLTPHPHPLPRGEGVRVRGGATT